MQRGSKQAKFAEHGLQAYKAEQHAASAQVQSTGMEQVRPARSVEQAGKMQAELMSMRMELVP